jgi:prepilin-type processing-associated H-X9-DG protein
MPWGRLSTLQLPPKFGYFSYAMNSCLELDQNAWPPPGGSDYPMPSFLDTARIVAPERVILLFEQLLDPRKGFDGRTLYRSAGKYCGSYPKAFSARHPRSGSRLGGNLLYCDNHVEWQRSVWRSGWDADQEVPPRNDPSWFPYPPADTHGR